MADTKISTLPTATSVNGRDILMVVVRSGSSTFINKKIEGDVFFGNIASNTVVNADFTVHGNTSLEDVSATKVTANVMETASLKVSGNGVIINTAFTPGSSGLDDNAFPIGKVTYDANYIYIKVAANTIKRAALSSF